MIELTTKSIAAAISINYAMLAIESIIILLVSKSILDNDFAFRNYYYIVTYISWELTVAKKKLYVDANYTIIIVNRTFIFSIAVIKKIATKILIRELRFKIYYSNKFNIIIFYIKRVLSNGTRAFAEIIREIYIVDNLKTKMLIEVDILILKRIIINFVT